MACRDLQDEEVQIARENQSAKSCSQAGCVHSKMKRDLSMLKGLGLVVLVM